MRARQLLVSLGVITPLLLTGPPAQAAQPSVLSHVGSTTKVLVVTTASWAATSGRATAWQKVDGRWRPVRASMPVHVGRAGFSTHRREGDGTSPAGTYLFRYAFGSRADPGVHLAWRALVPHSCWSGERADYNRWVHRVCTARDEDLWASRAVAYRYAAVIGFNDSPAVWGRGSGIFLHEDVGRPTRGCLAVHEGDLVALLRWMTPGTKVVMGPESYVATL